MTETTSLYILAASFFLGLFLGGYSMFRATAARSKNKAVSGLEKAHDLLAARQIQIAEHFGQTAHLLANLNKQHSLLCDYINKSAMQLGDIDINALPNQEKASFLPPHESTANPPLDYAANRQKTGTLSEDYRLREEQIKIDGSERGHLR